VQAGFNAELATCLASYGTQLPYASLKYMDAVLSRKVASVCTEVKLDGWSKEKVVYLRATGDFWEALALCILELPREKYQPQIYSRRVGVVRKFEETGDYERNTSNRYYWRTNPRNSSGWNLCLISTSITMTALCTMT